MLGVCNNLVIEESGVSVEDGHLSRACLHHRLIAMTNFKKET